MADTYYSMDSGFFDAQYDAETSTYDRQYGASDMIKPYSRIVADGIFGIYNPEPSTGDADTVKGDDFKTTVQSGSNNTVTVAAGQGIIKGHWFQLNQSIPIETDANPNPGKRADSIIIQIDTSLAIRAVRIVYRTGTSYSNENPTPPALQAETDTLKEMRVCNIIVNGITESQGISVVDTRATDECPLVTGLLQQISLGERLNQFDSEVEDKINSYDAALAAKIEEFETAWDAFFDPISNTSTGTWATWFDSTQTAWTSWFDGVSDATTGTWITWFNGVKEDWNDFFDNVSADIGVKVWNGYYDASSQIAASTLIAWTSFSGGSLDFSTYTYSSTRDTVFLYKNGFKLRGDGKNFSVAAGGITIVDVATQGAEFEVVIYRTAEPVSTPAISVGM